MPKSNEDRLQEAIEDALDGRAIRLPEDWRHPIKASAALSVLIKRRQRAAFDEGVRETTGVFLTHETETIDVHNPYEE